MPSAHTLPPFIVDDGSGSIFFFFNLVNTYQTLLHSYLFREIELIRWHGFIVITTTFRYSSFYPYEFSVDHRYFNLRSLSTVIRLFAHTERKKKKKKSRHKYRIRFNNNKRKNKIQFWGEMNRRTNETIPFWRLIRVKICRQKQNGTDIYVCTTIWHRLSHCIAFNWQIHAHRAQFFSLLLRVAQTSRKANSNVLLLSLSLSFSVFGHNIYFNIKMYLRHLRWKAMQANAENIAGAVMAHIDNNEPTHKK